MKSLLISTKAKWQMNFYRFLPRSVWRMRFYGFLLKGFEEDEIFIGCLHEFYRS